MRQSASRRMSARAAAVSNSSGLDSMVDLHDQHRRRDQQHAGNRIQHGVDVLDDIVHPAAEIAGGDAEADRQRQRDQGGEGADDQTGADALEGDVEHVLPDLVGAEHVIAGASWTITHPPASASAPPRGPPCARPAERAVRQAASHAVHRNPRRGAPATRPAAQQQQARQCTLRHAGSVRRAMSGTLAGILQMRAAVLAGADNRAPSRHRAR
jgi:hypothetical protein